MCINGIFVESNETVCCLVTPSCKRYCQFLKFYWLEYHYSYYKSVEYDDCGTSPPPHQKYVLFLHRILQVSIFTQTPIKKNNSPLVIKAPKPLEKLQGTKISYRKFNMKNPPTPTSLSRSFYLAVICAACKCQQGVLSSTRVRRGTTGTLICGGGGGTLQSQSHARRLPSASLGRRGVIHWGCEEFQIFGTNVGPVRRRMDRSPPECQEGAPSLNPARETSTERGGWLARVRNVL